MSIRGIYPPNAQELAIRTGKTIDEVVDILDMVHHSMEPVQRRIPVIENGCRQVYAVVRKGVGILTTSHGRIWQYDFEIDDVWRKYSVLFVGEIDNRTLNPHFRNHKSVILRTDSGCETGQMFGDLTCECKDQLHEAIELISSVGEGLVINIPHQDGRGMGLPFKLATLTLQDLLGVNTVESASMLVPDSVIDARTYSGVVGILKFFGIPPTCNIDLATNNPEKIKVLVENGYSIGTQHHVVIKPTELTQRHLEAKHKLLGHNYGGE
jgi:3,4-dihydroxy 2-butanone 4-phosphate synthase/GTP cyclohydrolase II